MATIRVPASSANLGAGFDALGLALALHLEATTAASGATTADTDERHLAVRTYRAAGGTGPLAVRARFAGGRGLGFSAAARVAGIVAARLEAGDDPDTARARAYTDAVALEGHADNAAAACFGGLTVAVGEHVVRVPIGLEARVALWIPQAETSTKAARAQLPAEVPFGDAVANIGRAALFVAAMAAGRVDVLDEATRDRLHQDARLARAPDSREALESARRAGAWCAWLSGSGPAVAALCAPDCVEAVVAAMRVNGGGGVCEIDHQGVQVR